MYVRFGCSYMFTITNLYLEEFNTRILGIIVLKLNEIIVLV
jgi:hypothetical protein